MIEPRPQVILATNLLRVQEDFLTASLQRLGGVILEPSVSAERKCMALAPSEKGRTGFLIPRLLSTASAWSASITESSTKRISFILITYPGPKRLRVNDYVGVFPWGIDPIRSREKWMAQTLGGLSGPGDRRVLAKRAPSLPSQSVIMA